MSLFRREKESKKAKMKGVERNNPAGQMALSRQRMTDRTNGIVRLMKPKKRRK